MYKKNVNIKDEIKAILNPLVTEAKTTDIVTSAADNGEPTISITVPIIFPIITEELE